MSSLSYVAMQDSLKSNRGRAVCWCFGDGSEYREDEYPHPSFLCFSKDSLRYIQKELDRINNRTARRNK